MPTKVQIQNKTTKAGGEGLKTFYIVTLWLCLQAPGPFIFTTHAGTVEKKAQIILSELRSMGIKAKITETYRSQSRQNALYAQGRTKPGRIVTYTLHSKHTQHKAFDIAILTRSGKTCADPREYAVLGALAKDHGLTWGGNWKMRDYMHMELKGGPR